MSERVYVKGEGDVKVDVLWSRRVADKIATMMELKYNVDPNRPILLPSARYLVRVGLEKPLKEAINDLTQGFWNPLWRTADFWADRLDMLFSKFFGAIGADYGGIAITKDGKGAVVEFGTTGDILREPKALDRDEMREFIAKYFTLPAVAILDCPESVNEGEYFVVWVATALENPFWNVRRISGVWLSGTRVRIEASTNGRDWFPISIDVPNVPYVAMSTDPVKFVMDLIDLIKEGMGRISDAMFNLLKPVFSTISGLIDRLPLEVKDILAREFADKPLIPEEGKIPVPIKLSIGVLEDEVYTTWMLRAAFLSPDGKVLAYSEPRTVKVIRPKAKLPKLKVKLTVDPPRCDIGEEVFVDVYVTEVFPDGSEAPVEDAEVAVYYRTGEGWKQLRRFWDSGPPVYHKGRMRRVPWIRGRVEPPVGHWTWPVEAKYGGMFTLIAKVTAKIPVSRVPGAGKVTKTVYSNIFELTVGPEIGPVARLVPSEEYTITGTYVEFDASVSNLTDLNLTARNLDVNGITARVLVDGEETTDYEILTPDGEWVKPSGAEVLMPLRHNRFYTASMKFRMKFDKPGDYRVEFRVKLAEGEVGDWRIIHVREAPYRIILRLDAPDKVEVGEEFRLNAFLAMELPHKPPYYGPVGALPGGVELTPLSNVKLEFYMGDKLIGKAYTDENGEAWIPYTLSEEGEYEFKVCTREYGKCSNVVKVTCIPRKVEVPVKITLPKGRVPVCTWSLVRVTGPPNSTVKVCYRKVGGTRLTCTPVRLDEKGEGSYTEIFMERGTYEIGYVKDNEFIKQGEVEVYGPYLDRPVYAEAYYKGNRIQNYVTAWAGEEIYFYAKLGEFPLGEEKCVREKYEGYPVKLCVTGPEGTEMREFKLKVERKGDRLRVVSEYALKYTLKVGTYDFYVLYDGKRSNVVTVQAFAKSLEVHLYPSGEVVAGKDVQMVIEGPPEQEVNVVILRDGIEVWRRTYKTSNMGYVVQWLKFMTPCSTYTIRCFIGRSWEEAEARAETSIRTACGYIGLEVSPEVQTLPAPVKIRMWTPELSFDVYLKAVIKDSGGNTVEVLKGFIPRGSTEWSTEWVAPNPGAYYIYGYWGSERGEEYSETVPKVVSVTFQPQMLAPGALAPEAVEVGVYRPELVGGNYFQFVRDVTRVKVDTVPFGRIEEFEVREVAGTGRLRMARAILPMMATTALMAVAILMAGSIKYYANYPSLHKILNNFLDAYEEDIEKIKSELREIRDGLAYIERKLREATQADREADQARREGNEERRRNARRRADDARRDADNRRRKNNNRLIELGKWFFKHFLRLWGIFSIAFTIAIIFLQRALSHSWIGIWYCEADLGLENRGKPVKVIIDYGIEGKSRWEALNREIKIPPFTLLTLRGFIEADLPFIFYLLLEIARGSARVTYSNASTLKRVEYIGVDEEAYPPRGVVIRWNKPWELGLRTYWIIMYGAVGLVGPTVPFVPYINYETFIPFAPLPFVGNIRLIGMDRQVLPKTDLHLIPIEWYLTNVTVRTSLGKFPTKMKENKLPVLDREHPWPANDPVKVGAGEAIELEAVVQGRTIVQIAPKGVEVLFRYGELESKSTQTVFKAPIRNLTVTIGWNGKRTAVKQSVDVLGYKTEPIEFYVFEAKEATAAPPTDVNGVLSIPAGYIMAPKEAYPLIQNLSIGITEDIGYVFIMNYGTWSRVSPEYFYNIPVQVMGRAEPSIDLVKVTLPPGIELDKPFIFKGIITEPSVKEITLRQGMFYPPDGYLAVRLLSPVPGHKYQLTAFLSLPAGLGDLSIIPMNGEVKVNEETITIKGDVVEIPLMSKIDEVLLLFRIMVPDLGITGTSRKTWGKISFEYRDITVGGKPVTKEVSVYLLPHIKVKE